MRKLQAWGGMNSINVKKWFAWLLARPAANGVLDMALT